jgi:hypothetical protein
MGGSGSWGVGPGSGNKGSRERDQREDGRATRRPELAERAAGGWGQGGEEGVRRAGLSVENEEESARIQREKQGLAERGARPEGARQGLWPVFNVIVGKRPSGARALERSPWPRIAACCSCQQ